MSRQADRVHVLERGNLIMKKKLMAVLALMLIIALQTSVVYATESPTSGEVDIEDVVDDAVMPPTGSTLSGNLVMVSGEDSYFYIYRLTSVNNVITESRNASIGIDASSDESFVTLTDTTLNIVRNKLLEIQKEAYEQGKDIDGIAFDMDASGDKLTVTFIDERIEANDLANGLVKVFHLKDDGTWEEPNFISYDGGVVVGFENGVSPVMIVKYTDITDYAQKPGTISGDATSPKTSGTVPYTIPVGIAVVGLVGIVIFGRKLVRK